MGSEKSRKTLGADAHRLPVVALSCFAAFVILLAGTGGASRYDALQIVPLRAGSALVFIVSLFFVRIVDIKRNRVVGGLFGALFLLVGIQLIPLPPEVWRSLPTHAEIGELGAAVAADNVWRPVSLSPFRSWNALASLVVPAAALMIAIATGAPALLLLRTIFALGVLDALLGLLQVVTGEWSVFYLYEVTNRGSPVGLFANENHSAVFAACTILVATNLWLMARETRSYPWERFVYPTGYLLMLFTALVGGSRAGLLAAVAAIGISVALLVLTPRPSKKVARGKRRAQWRWPDKHPRLALMIPVSVLAVVILVFLALDRIPAFDSLLSEDGFRDLRWSLLPVLGRMLDTHYLTGAGFGSFEQLYHVYEPTSLLMPQYINQAHNDVLQLAIEGGVLAGLLLGMAILWIGRCIAMLASDGKTRSFALFWAGIFLIVVVASVVDYPLRTPLFQVVLIWFLVALSRDKSRTSAVSRSLDRA